MESPKDAMLHDDDATQTAMPGQAGAEVKSPDEHVGNRRDPEGRLVDQQDKDALREKMLDKTRAYVTNLYSFTVSVIEVAMEPKVLYSLASE